MTAIMTHKLEEMRAAKAMIKQQEQDEQCTTEERDWVRDTIAMLREQGKIDTEVSSWCSSYEAEYRKGKQVWMQGLADGKDESALDSELAEITPYYSKFKRLWEIDARES